MASISKRPNGKWRARYRDHEGREHARHFPRKVDAQRWLDEVTTSVLTGQYVAPDAGRITFREYAEQWRASQVHRPSTAVAYEGHLRRRAYPTFGARPIGEIRPSEIQGWVKHLSLTYAPATVAVAHGIVAAVFKAAIRDRRIVASPCEGTKLPKVTTTKVTRERVLTVDQVLALQAAIPDRYRALVVLGAAAGPRISEALGLTVDRTGLMPPSRRPRLRIDRQLVHRSGRPPYLGPPKREASVRDVPLPQVAVEALAALLAAFSPTLRDMPVCDDAGREQVEQVALTFTTSTGRPVKLSSLSKVWRPAVEAAGLPDGTSYHDLRHFYASLLIRHGESVKVVQARLGHATAAETLDTYSHLWPDSEDRTRQAVDSVLGTVSRGPSVAQQGG